MARDEVVRVRLTDERNADLEEAAKSYGVAPATMATVIIGEWLDKRKREPSAQSQEAYRKLKEFMDSQRDGKHAGELIRNTFNDVARREFESLQVPDEFIALLNGEKGATQS